MYGLTRFASGSNPARSATYKPVTQLRWIFKEISDIINSSDTQNGKKK